jgi:hypothetical protein
LEIILTELNHFPEWKIVLKPEHFDFNLTRNKSLEQCCSKLPDPSSLVPETSNSRGKRNNARSLKQGSDESKPYATDEDNDYVCRSSDFSSEESNEQMHLLMIMSFSTQEMQNIRKVLFTSR